MDNIRICNQEGSSGEIEVKDLHYIKVNGMLVYTHKKPKQHKKGR